MQGISPGDAYAFFKEKARQYEGTGYDVMGERCGFLEWSGDLPGPILEIGTGRGYFTACLSSLGEEIISVDLDEDMLSFAKAFLIAWAGRSDKSCADKVEFVKIEDENKFPFKDASFRTITSFNMWHHLKDSLPLLNEIKRLLMPRGVLLLADFSEDGFELVDRLHIQNYGIGHPVLRRGFDDVLEFFDSKNVSRYVSKYETGVKILV